jgi:hypothetical protein
MNSKSDAYRAGRAYASNHELPPCGQWLRDEGFVDPFDRHHFLMGFRHEKAADPRARPVDPLRFECRCREESGDALPYPYFGA